MGKPIPEHWPPLDFYLAMPIMGRLDWGGLARLHIVYILCQSVSGHSVDNTIASFMHFCFTIYTKISILALRPAVVPQIYKPIFPFSENQSVTDTNYCQLTNANQ